MDGDKGYDSQENLKELWDEYQIKPVVDLIHKWKEDPDAPRLMYPDRVDTIFYNRDGHVLCRNLDTEDESKNYAPMAYQGFERHFIRGKKKMKVRMGLALIVMLAMAVGWIESGEGEKMRSLVQPRAA